MKKYWQNYKHKSLSDKELKPISQEETNPSLINMLSDIKKEGTASRRDFLKFCGYSFAVTALASCQTKVRNAVPYIVAPREITPGEANYYASSYMNGSDYCSIIVKTREGRPIKIEGNPESGINAGGTSARVQASLLELYDTNRFHGPKVDGKSTDWEQTDAALIEAFESIAEKHGKICLLTPSVYSPSLEAVIAGFLEKYPGSEWVQYDACSASAILEANAMSFGKQVVPDYRFDKADVIVSIGADFLGSWLSPVEYTRQFSTRKDPDKEMCHLVQYESILSLTGSNADKRIRIKPSEELPVLLNIYKGIAKAVEGLSIDVPDSPHKVSETVKHLLSARGSSLVISSSNDAGIQLLVNEINRLLGNIGETILLDSYLRTKRAIDSKMADLVDRMNQGDVDALLMWNVNPAYTWHDSKEFTEALSKVGLTVSLSGSPNETTRAVKYICPDNHYLESWNDCEARKHKYSLMQPVIDKLFDTRQMPESLLKWTGSENSYYEFLNAHWTERMMPMQSEHLAAVAFFDNTLQKGVFEPTLPQSAPEAETGTTSEIEESARTEGMGQGPEALASGFDLSELIKQANAAVKGSELVLYESNSLGEGTQANNPWLQELPDPISKICWDNYATISPAMAKENALSEGDLLDIHGINVPVHIQPGQSFGTIGLALGYGRANSGPVGDGVGVNAFSMTGIKDGNIAYSSVLDGLQKAGEGYSFAQTQTHHSMEGRGFVREANHEEYKQDSKAGNEAHEHFLEHSKSLYKEREYPSHHWALAIDLSTCTGCANCVIACQAENNIPVVGKEEVQRVHEMHWMRIDRYFSGDEEDPEVVFQPVLCQHCDNAPCENVCPVAATNHSTEGLNQMVYNRCIGTRYCNNNCPYKVRRFNWFNYTEAGTLKGNLRDSAGMTEDLRRMVLNPDVTVRSQGVIEKCSFCVQRIQAAKLKAKKESRAIDDEELQTACSQTCPANAIVFGDLNDERSEISKLVKSGRRYNLLEELYTKPSVHYLTKIRNRKS